MSVPQDKQQVISNQMVPRKPEKHRPSLDWHLTSKHEDDSHLQENNVEGILNVVGIDMVVLFFPFNCLSHCKTNFMQNCQSDDDGLIVIVTGPFSKYPNIMISLVPVWPLPLAQV
jgi:hypothetical protein